MPEDEKSRTAGPVKTNRGAKEHRGNKPAGGDRRSCVPLKYVTVFRAA